MKQPTPPLERRRVVVPDRAQPCKAEGILRQQLKRLENWGNLWELYILNVGAWYVDYQLRSMNNLPDICSKDAGSC